MNPFSSVLVTAVLPKTQSDYIKSAKESNYTLYTKNKKKEKVSWFFSLANGGKT